MIKLDFLRRIFGSNTALFAPFQIIINRCFDFCIKHDYRITLESYYSSCVDNLTRENIIFFIKYCFTNIIFVNQYYSPLGLDRRGHYSLIKREIFEVKRRYYREMDFLMKLYHYLNGLYRKLKDISEDKLGIWFTTSADGYNGQSWLFRYDVEINEADPKLIERKFDANTSKIRWYTYNAEQLEYDNVVCLNCEFSQLIERIKEFRAMIDATDFSVLTDSEWFREFPHNCCGDTVNLLWKYLQIKFNGKFDKHIKYRNGVKNKQWHAWLEYKGIIIIDITADQFSDIEEPVVITTKRGVYDAFKIFRKKTYIEPDFYNFQKENRDRLSRIYKLICTGKM